MTAALLLVGFVPWRILTWGHRTSVGPRDYEVVRTILRVPPTQPIKIERAYVETYTPFPFPAPDPSPEAYTTIYRVVSPDGNTEQLLDFSQYEERNLGDAQLYAETVRKHFSMGEIKRYLTWTAGKHSGEIFLCLDKRRRALYILTRGVDFPGYWEPRTSPLRTNR